jgi:predicted RNase H-like HicB family nuclease
MHYVALIDGEPGAYGVVFPDLPGCTAMGATLDDARARAFEALRHWAEATRAAGHDVPAARSLDALAADPEFQEARAESLLALEVVLVERMGRPAKANMSLDSGILAAIDDTARRFGLTRSGLIERMAEERLPDYA